MSEQEPSLPELEFRVGGITITPTASRRKPNGPVAGMPFFRLEKWYKDQTSGEARRTGSYLLEELPKLALVAMKAYEYFALQINERHDGGAAADHKGVR
jgi:hypothetical protein